jgi:hypothetical protein
MYDEHLRPAGLTIGQYSVLAVLYYVPSIPLRKLASAPAIIWNLLEGLTRLLSATMGYALSPIRAARALLKLRCRLGRRLLSNE